MTKPPYYISPYGIAVKHGFRGTEEEWLESLKGGKGEDGHGFRVLGVFGTYKELLETVTEPSSGDAYGVGTEEEYQVYIFDGVSGKWRNWGTLRGEKEDAADSAREAKSWAVGETGSRENEERDNARYYAGTAQSGAEQSELSAASAREARDRAVEAAAKATADSADAKDARDAALGAQRVAEAAEQNAGLSADAAAAEAAEASRNAVRSETAAEVAQIAQASAEAARTGLEVAGKEAQKARDEAVRARESVCHAIRTDIMIPAEVWTATGDGYRAEVPVEDVTAGYDPIVTVYRESRAIARRAKLDHGAETTDEGTLCFAAEKQPEDAIHAHVLLVAKGAPAGEIIVGPVTGGCECCKASGGMGGGSYTLQPATADKLGGVKIGGGVDVQKDGTISVDAESIMNEGVATPEEVREMFAGVIGEEQE